jgi:long-chain acyl-CoA synthetase
VTRDTLLDVFRSFSDAPETFLAYDDGFRKSAYSYTDVCRAARGFAERLHAAGLGKGDKVVFYAENCPEWIVAFWGSVLVGAIVVPIDYRSSPDFLLRVSRLVSARVVLVGRDVPPSQEWESQTQEGQLIWPLETLSWADGSVPPVQLGRDDVAEIIFTSGATAEPKGVVITHRNILANVVPVEREVIKYRKWGKPFFPLRFLNLLPLSHMFGQAMATFIPPMLPGTVIFMRGYNPEAIVSLIRNERVSVLVSVPKILSVLREHITRAVGQAAVTPVPQGRSNPGMSGAVMRILKRWWRHRLVHRPFGWKFWAFVVGAAPLEAELEAFWGELGFAVIQGYGLTETAPIVTLNHPFGTRRGSVGKTIAGVKIKVAPDGEILVKGDNVTSGYFNAPEETARAFEDGWFHTGDIGEVSDDGQVFIRGRKKEVIVTPEGLNVFPEDVERVLLQTAGVNDAAVVGAGVGSEGAERVHAVLVVKPGTQVDSIVRSANAQLADHQRIRRALVWPAAELPRTEGTRKLKRAVIREWVKSGRSPTTPASDVDRLRALVAKYAGRADLSDTTTIEELGLSSLERVELMVALEEAFQTRIDETAFARAGTLEDLRTVVTSEGTGEASSPEPGPAKAGPHVPAPAKAGAHVPPVEFPRWNRSAPARAIRRVSLPTWILPLARIFAWIRVDGRHHLDTLTAPVIFAVNHQSHMDTPVVLAALPARFRYRTSTAMAKEFFKAHFFPKEYGRRAWLTNSFNYYLAALFFNAFPLPQREAGARQTLRYIGEVLADGHSVLIYPEGRRSESDDVQPFRSGIGMIAAKLRAPVVPVRIRGLNQVLHPSWRMARPGRVHVSFGAPMQLSGDDYEVLAKRVEAAVRAL